MLFISIIAIIAIILIIQGPYRQLTWTKTRVWISVADKGWSLLIA